MKQEIDIMRQLDHPNIVKLIEVQEVHNAVVLIMEYVDGSELKKLNMGLSFQDVITIVHAILSVLSYLENLGIVHRDLKPSNIMITKGEFVQTDSVKLFDFGLAAFLSEKLLLTKCGTPGYIAPEILCASSKDKIVVSPSVDVYSLGIILYEMLFKSNPFKDASKPDSKRVVRKNAQSSIDYDRPCIYKPFITPQFMQLLVDMTQKSDITRPLASTLLESEVFKAVCKTGRKEKKSPDYHPMLEENVVSQLSKDTYRFKVNQNRFRADSPTIKRFLPRPTPLLIDPITTLDLKLGRLNQKSYFLLLTTQETSTKVEILKNIPPNHQHPSIKDTKTGIGQCHRWQTLPTLKFQLGFLRGLHRLQGSSRVMKGIDMHHLIIK